MPDLAIVVEKICQELPDRGGEDASRQLRDQLLNSSRSLLRSNGTRPEDRRCSGR